MKWHVLVSGIVFWGYGNALRNLYVITALIISTHWTAKVYFVVLPFMISSSCETYILCLVWYFSKWWENFLCLIEYECLMCRMQRRLKNHQAYKFMAKYNYWIRKFLYRPQTLISIVFNCMYGVSSFSFTAQCPNTARRSWQHPVRDPVPTFQWSAQGQGNHTCQKVSPKVTTKLLTALLVINFYAGVGL